MAPLLQRHAVFDLPHILGDNIWKPGYSDVYRRESQIPDGWERWHSGPVPEVVVVIVEGGKMARVDRELVQGSVAESPAMLSNGVPTCVVFVVRSAQSAG